MHCSYVINFETLKSNNIAITIKRITLLYFLFNYLYYHCRGILTVVGIGSFVVAKSAVINQRKEQKLVRDRIKKAVVEEEASNKTSKQE